MTSIQALNGAVVAGLLAGAVPAHTADAAIADQVRFQGEYSSLFDLAELGLTTGETIFVDAVYDRSAANDLFSSSLYSNASNGAFISFRAWTADGELDFAALDNFGTIQAAVGPTATDNFNIFGNSIDPSSGASGGVVNVFSLAFTQNALTDDVFVVEPQILDGVTDYFFDNPIAELDQQFLNIGTTSGQFVSAEYVSHTVAVVPAPAGATVAGLCVAAAARRRRGSK